MSQAIALADLDWEADAQAALIRVAREGKPFDAYSLTELAELRDPPSPAMWGITGPAVLAVRVVPAVSGR